MNGVGLVRAELTFLPRSQGGRSSLPFLGTLIAGGGYMPHLVVEGSAEYLGVRFVCGPQPLFNEPVLFELVLIYPGVDYSVLVPGALVTVREGGRIVAQGCILEQD